MTLRSVLLSVQQMLCNPEPKNPQDAVVAKQYMKDINLFNVSFLTSFLCCFILQETAKFWTQVYANAPGFKNEEMSTKVQKLTQDMGYNEVGLRHELKIQFLKNGCKIDFWLKNNRKFDY